MTLRIDLGNPLHFIDPILGIQRKPNHSNHGSIVRNFSYNSTIKIVLVLEVGYILFAIHDFFRTIMRFVGMDKTPSKAELRILKVLWGRGPSTVKSVWIELGEKPSYNGVLKQMQVMHENGLLSRDESQRSHVYSADGVRTETAKKLVEDLRKKVFQGSASKLVASALTESPVSTEELQEIRDLIDQLEQGNKNDRR